MSTWFRWTALVGILVVAGGTRAHAQNDRDDRGRDDRGRGLHLSGLLNDATTPTFGAWEIHGVWSLDLTGGQNTADFTATLTMERSDLYFVGTPGADANNLAVRNAHTHHISVVHGTVTPIPGGFRVSSMADETVVTGNGASAPFEPVPPTSTVQIDVTGGGLVPFSNIAVTFGGAAVKHFGSNPIAGAVKASVER